MKKLNMVINPENRKSKINKEIYGHFSEHLGRCIYEGFYVGEDSKIPNTNGVRNDIIDALKEIKIPVLRWPGGCFADEYHWKDGIGEKATRKKMINTHWGGVTEDNSFGTHEFLNMCETLGCEPYIAGNVGSGTVQELDEWVEYMTFDGVSPMAELRRKNGREKPWKVKYLGIGNENWGCGGNMRPEYYADLYRRYSTYCRNFSGNELFKIACGPNANDYNWTEKLLSAVNSSQTKGISLHYYTIPSGDWSKKGDAVEFDEKEYYSTLKGTWYIDELIRCHSELMSHYDSGNQIGIIVDEWGCWYDVEKGTNPGFLYQQNTMRDAIVASINLNIFNNRSDRVIMANVAQCVNVLQAVILTEGDKMIKTPTYHVFDLYKEHQEANLVDSFVSECKTEDGLQLVSHSVSEKDGKLHITVSNASLDEEITLNCTLCNAEYGKLSARILSGDMSAHNTFDAPETVAVKAYDGAKLTEKGLEIKLPPCSVVAVTLE